jgi:vesicular inhibitory amino acid transporter
MIAFRASCQLLMTNKNTKNSNARNNENKRRTTQTNVMSKDDLSTSTSESSEANLVLLKNERQTAAQRIITTTTTSKSWDESDSAAATPVNVVAHPVGNSTTNQALANSVNILLGVGTLSVPYALREAGWAGIVVLLVLGASTNYTGKTLIKCQRKGSLPMRSNFNTYSDKNEDGNVTVVKRARRALTTYEDIGEAAFGDFGRSLISWVLYAELIGTCGLFFILEGDHLHLLFESTMQSKEKLMFLAALIMIPTTWLADLSKLSFIGALGFIASVGLTGVVGWDLVQALNNPSYQFPHTSLIHAASYPLSFGLLAFVFAGHAVFPAIYTSMQKPQEYEEMLDKTYGVVMLNCLLLGCAGYYLFGDKVSSEVTLDLPKGLISTVALALITINPLAKFALTMDPVARGVEEKMNLDISKNDDNDLLKARFARTGLGLLALFLAVELPFFGVAMSLVGAVLTLSVSLIFPTACYLKMFGDELEPAEKWLNYAIVGLGFICVASGTTSALLALLDASNDFGM